MKNFFYLLLAINISVIAHNNHHTSNAQECYGTIIFITGSCSSGKSTLARNIAQALNADYLAFDEYVMPRVLQKMIARSVGNVLAFMLSKLLIRNFFTLIGMLSEKTKYNFQKKFYAALQDGIACEPTQRMYQKARNLAINGNNVVIEAPLQLGDGIDCLSSLSELNNLKVTFVLAYCPFQNLIERIMQRNKSRDKQTHRELDWAIGNYVHYFTFSHEDGLGAIDSVDGNSVKSFIDKHSQTSFKKLRLHLLQETRNAVLQKITDDARYYVYPKLRYDLIINTQKHSTKQAQALVVHNVRNTTLFNYSTSKLK